MYFGRHLIVLAKLIEGKFNEEIIQRCTETTSMKYGAHGSVVKGIRPVTKKLWV